MCVLSVVIVTRNEEQNIAACILSVLKALDSFNDYEVLLVDSDSTDRTIEIAQRYAIRTIQLSANCFLSPSAGEYIGLQHSDGKYIFFLDGDMTVVENWFHLALPVLRRERGLAGVSGRCQEIHYDADHRRVGEIGDRFAVSESCLSVEHLGGAALYRRSALMEVGGFNPWLSDNEELELGLRLFKAGYSLARCAYRKLVLLTGQRVTEVPSDGKVAV
ncbi:glycosyltransferase [Candidatus Hydrogenedentota bacterium]